MYPPLTIKLPDGLELTMWPRQPVRNLIGQVIVPGETEREVWLRMARSLRTHDFDALARVYQVPECPALPPPQQKKT